MVTSVPGDSGYDEASKAAVHAGLLGLLRLVDADLSVQLSTANSEPPRPLPVDLPATVHRADLLYRFGDGSLLHIEIQQHPDPVMGRRMVEYGIRLAAVHSALRGRGAAVQIVVQVRGRPMPTRYEWAGITGSFHLLHIPSLDTEVLLATPALAPFALIPGGAKVVPAVARTIAATTDSILQGKLATLAVRLAPDLARILVEQLKENDMSTEIIVRELRNTDVGRTMLAEGRSEERHAAVVAVLRHRFPDADQARLDRTAERISGTRATDQAVDAAFAVSDLDS